MLPELRTRLTAKNETGPAFRQLVDDARKASGSVASSSRAMTGSVGNLAAQFNDIGVQLAGGQSPLLIAMQQGSQITQVLGPMGAGGAVKALGGAFLSLLSPVNLLTMGVIAAGGAAVQWLLSTTAESPKAEERLKAHADWLSRILQGYDAAEKAARSYIDEAQRLPQEVAMATLADRQKSALEGLNAALDAVIGKQLRIARGDTSGMGQFALQAREWHKQLQSGEIALDELALRYQQISSEDALAAGVRRFATEQLFAINNIRTMQGETRSLAAAIASLSFPAVPSGFTDALDALGKLAPARLSDRDQALTSLNAGLGSAQDEIQRQALRMEYQSALARITAAEAAAKLASGTTSLPAATTELATFNTSLIETADRTSQLSRTIAGSLTNATTGFFQAIRQGGSVVDALTQQLGNLADPLLSSAISGFFSNLFGGSIFGSLGSDIGPGATFGGVQDFLRSAKGNVFSGAGISAYSGSIVSQPTLFPFASGVGLMGEAGPEAILPLSRGPDGRLGVEAGSGSRGGDVVQHFHIDARGAEIGVEEKIVRAIKTIVPPMIDTQAPVSVAKANRNRGL